MTPVAHRDNNNSLAFTAAFDYFVHPIFVQFKHSQFFYNHHFSQLLNQNNTNTLQVESWLEALHPDDVAHFKVKWQNFQQDQQDFSYYGRLYHQLEQRFDWYQLNFKVHHDGVVDWMLQATNIQTHLPADQDSLAFSSFEYDELTGLYNRKSFQQHLENTLNQAKNQQQQLGLLLLDVDYFHHINDTLGYAAGDLFLTTFSLRLQQQFKKHRILSRLGNDEFAILVYPLQNTAELTEIATQAQQLMKNPIYYQDHPLSCNLSFGCAHYPTHAQQALDLLQYAETALHSIKNNGRGGFQMFEPQMHQSLKDQATQFHLARQLLQAKVIEPYYQPKVRLSDGKVIGFEALLRWRDAQGNIQLPTRILDAFADYELARRISETMQTKIFQDIRTWLANQMNVLPISINAAPVEFLRDDYAETLLERLKTYQIPHHVIEIEITEQSLMEHGSPFIIRALHLLKQAGIRISLDDFGTGHSSFSRLKDYPVDCIKIDRSFVTRMHDDASILAIVRAIGQLGPSMSVDILAEGIEFSEQLQTLKDCACDIGQGFYFYQPMSFQHTSSLLQKHS